MRLHIAYHTEYAYGARVSFSPHLFRLFPRTEHGLTVQSQEFVTNATGVVSYRRDLFDNPIASVFYPDAAEKLEATLKFHLSIEPRNAFNFLLASHALKFPFVYTDEEFAALAAYLPESSADRALKLPFWSRPAGEKETMEVLLGLNRAIYEQIRYERREEGDPRSPEETIKLLSGSCRDYAVLLNAMLHQLGVASRLASGFLIETGEVGDRVAHNALHAWVEAYLPGAGWIGFDPTNGYLCDHHHLATAVGTTPAQITPILGTFYANRDAQITPAMTARLEVTPEQE